MNGDIGNSVAIMAVDAGTTTGVARGVFSQEDTGGVWQGLRQGAHVDSWEVTGSPSEQAWEIIPEWSEWIGWPECRRLGVRTHVLVIEDFVVRLGPGASSRRDLLDPVRVTSACDVLCIQRNGIRWAFPVLQQPSSALNFATNERLKEHKLWVKGSAHRRDAMRHVALRYAIILGSVKEEAR